MFDAEILLFLKKTFYGNIKKILIPKTKPIISLQIRNPPPPLYIQNIHKNIYTNKYTHNIHIHCGHCGHSLWTFIVDIHCGHYVTWLSTTKTLKNIISECEGCVKTFFNCFFRVIWRRSRQLYTKHIKNKLNFDIYM
jgi:hypothetical protein